MKSSTLHIRIDPEYYAKLKKDAAFFDMTLTELVLESLNVHIGQLHNGVSMGIAELGVSLESDAEARAVCLKGAKEHAEQAEYYIRELRALRIKAKLYQEIEGLESYRDFLRETVVTEKA